MIITKGRDKNMSMNYLGYRIMETKIDSITDFVLANENDS
jgi:hypothetical protein